MEHNEFKLNNPPEDCISSVAFGHDSRHLLTSSWDCTVRLYDVKTNQLRTRYFHEAPVLDATFQSSHSVWSAGADNKLKKFDVETQSETTVGGHMEPIRKVVYNSEMDLVATGSWDSHMKLWDSRLGDCVADNILPDKVYAMAVCGHQIIVGLAGRLVQIWDLRNMTQTQKDPVLPYQLRCIDSFADKRGYVVGSIEGRVAVEYLDPNFKSYKFKCHRHKDPITGVDIIYPINAISFHQRYGTTFATAGSDGIVCIWDGKNQKRIVQFHKYPTSVSSVSFSPDGNNLAIASSYIHANEDTMPKSIKQDSIYIRKIHDHEVRTKNG